jgi:hypothetical protein
MTHRLKDPCTIEGRWWIHGDEKPASYGVLNYEPEKGLLLTVNVPHLRTVDETFLSAIGRRAEVPNVIHGADEHNHPITLYGCSCRSHGVSTGLERYRIASMAALLGHQGTSWNESKFVTVGVEYSLLNQWMDRTGSQRRAIDPKAPMPLITIELKSGVRLIIESTFAWKGGLNSEEHHFGHRMWFLFREPITLHEMHDRFVGVMLRLLCLLTGSQVFLDHFIVSDDDPFQPSRKSSTTIELLQKSDGISHAERDRHAVHMVTSYQDVARRLQEVVCRWFECDEYLAPVLDLYSIVNAHAATPQHRFLLLAHAFEAYHGRSPQFKSTELSPDEHRRRIKEILDRVPSELKDWTKDRLAFANQKTLAQRIAEIINEHQSEVRQLTANFPDFANVVRHTRNYYTHYTENLLLKGKVAQGAELMKLALILEYLLEICLLKELGITGEAISRILDRASDIQFVELNPQPKENELPGIT